MPILTYAEYNHFYIAHIWEAKINLYIVRNVFIWSLWEQILSGYQTTIDNGAYMWTGTFNVAINEHLCKYNVTK